MRGINFYDPDEFEAVRVTSRPRARVRRSRADVALIGIALLFFTVMIFRVAIAWGEGRFG